MIHTTRGREVYRLIDGKHVRADDVVIPADMAAGDIAEYLVLSVLLLHDSMKVGENRVVELAQDKVSIPFVGLSIHRRAQHSVLHGKAVYNNGLIGIGGCRYPKRSGHIKQMIHSHQRPTAAELAIGSLVYMASGFLREWSGKWKARSASFSKKATPGPQPVVG